MTGELSGPSKLRLGITRRKVYPPPEGTEPARPFVYYSRLMQLSADVLTIELGPDEFLASIWLVDESGLPILRLPLGTVDQDDERTGLVVDADELGED